MADTPLNAPGGVLVIGAGPAGIATAIAASQRGLHATVLDARTPPIDKPCGEGVLPDGVAALHEIGIHLDSGLAVPFAGIRFIDEESSACSEFPVAAGYSLRRLKLHDILMERAIRAGVKFHWSVRIAAIHPQYVRVEQACIPYTWLVGADGQNSIVRKWVGLDSRTITPKRFGFRKHFQVCPWTDVVEVYWGEGCQMFVTPTGKQEVGVAVFSRDPHMRLEHALPKFPALARRLRDANPTSMESGNVTSLTRLTTVARGRVALVGDASGTVDAITGHGLSVSFQQALHLAEALEQENLALYEAAHRKILATPSTMTRLMLLMEGSNWIRRRALRLFQNQPGLFSKLLSIHAGELPLSSIGAGEMADFGWRLLWA